MYYYRKLNRILVGVGVNWCIHYTMSAIIIICKNAPYNTKIHIHIIIM